MADAHRTFAYQQARRALRDQQQPTCVLCHGQRGPIRYDLTYPDPLSFSAEHPIAVRHGGSHEHGLQPAHLVCQQQQGAAAVNAVRAGADGQPLTSGVW